MPELSKQALKVQNNTEFPNNNNGYITPARLRSFNVDMIDSNVNQTVYTTDSASFDARITAVSASGGNVSALNAFTASQQTQNATLATYTGSNDAKWSTLGGQSGSWITESETGSFARTDVDNNFTANQTFTNITAVSASFTYVKTLYETSSVIFSSGSNQLGDELTDTQVLSGSVLIVGSGSINGNRILTTADTASLSVATASVARNLIVVARNGGTSTLAAGTVVHITSAAGDNPIFTTASFDTETLSSNTFGLLRYSSAAGADVEVVVNGVVTGVNTDPTLGYTAGDIVYLSSSGQFTRVQPQAPNQIVVLGQVLRAQQNNGSIYVDINNGWEINELHNVQITNPQTGDVLQYESASYGLWKNKSLNGLGFATTGSNTFRGEQIVSGSIDVSDNIIGGYIDLRENDGGIFIRASGSNVIPGTGSFWSIVSQFQVGDLAFVQQPSNDKVITMGLNDRYVKFFKGMKLDGGFDAIDVGSAGGGLGLVLSSSVGGQTQLLTVQGNVSASNLHLTGTLTASLQQGYVWVGDANGRTATVSTSSFGSGGGGTTLVNPSVESISGSLLITANTFTSGAANILHLTSSAQAYANLVFKNNNLTGTTLISGSNNIFVNATAASAGRINYVGGSSNLFLNSLNTGAGTILPTITGSAASISGSRPAMNGNIISNGNGGSFTINQSPNPGTHTYSGNILSQGTVTINALGNVGVPGVSQPGIINVSSNSIIGGTLTLNASSRSIAEINTGASGSTRISINSNSILNGTLTYNGPVSASATAQIHQINGNSLQGTATFNIQSGSKAYTVSNNIINGVFGVTDNTVFAPTLGSGVTITQNNINGNIQLNTRASSSFSLVNNNLNTWTVSSDADTSAITTAANRITSLVTSALFGGVGNNILYSGSATGAVAKTITSVLMAGNQISASVGGGEQAIGATAVLGHGLNIIGTGIFNNTNNGVGGQNNGSLFTGRWNADGTRNTSAENIFVVGTGTSGSAGVVRKTGFLIDSGSNTFVEGTFNVSGSTSLNGQLIITGSLTASLSNGYVLAGNASGITYEVATSSFQVDTTAFATTGSNTFIGDQFITGAVYVSGALGQIDLDTVNGFLSIYNYDPGSSVSVNASSETGSISMIATGDRVSINDGGSDWFYATNDGQGNYSAVNSERDIIVTGSVTITDVLQLGQLDPLPGGADGQLAVSASNLYFYSGSAWNLIAFA